MSATSDNEILEDFPEEFRLTIMDLKIKAITARRFKEHGVSSTEHLLLLNEDELISIFKFSTMNIILLRKLKKAVNEKIELAKRPIPVSLINALPLFRGKETRSIGDPEGFLARFEGVMTSSEVDQSKWARTITLSLTTPEDTAYWTNQLSTFPNWNYADFRANFLQHFGRFDQRKKWMESLHQMKQAPNESVQTYLDRATECVRRSGCQTSDLMVVHYLRKGLHSEKLKQYLNLKEDPSKPFTFDNFCEHVLLGEDRLSDTPPSVPTEKRIICRHCGKAGHIRPDCRKLKEELKTAAPRPVPRTANPGPVCRNCPGSTHAFSNCPKNICASCKKPGHMNFNCPEAICSACNAKGHTPNSFICPKNPKIKKTAKNYLGMKSKNLNLPNLRPC